MIRSIIVDDEKNCRDTLLDSLKHYCPHVQVVAQCTNVSEALNVIPREKPDLVFMDVEMSDGTGFDVLEKLGTVNFDLIFVTAYDKYAVKAFKFSAIDFLLKPVVSDDLIEAIERLEKRKNIADSQLQLNLLLSNLKNLHGTINKIAIPSSDGLNLVEVKDIIRLEADGSYTSFITAGGNYVVSKSLKEYDELLSENNFLRIHQSHLVNLSFVKKYIRGEGGHLVMNDGTTVPVSVRKKPEVMERLSVI
jgi:two-component system, LytTR family, response regulator